MYSTTLTQHVNAPRAAVYRALIDPNAIARWRVPEGMHSDVPMCRGPLAYGQATAVRMLGFIPEAW